jgi:hypothetical protein
VSVKPVTAKPVGLTVGACANAPCVSDTTAKTVNKELVINLFILLLLLLKTTKYN